MVTGTDDGLGIAVVGIVQFRFRWGIASLVVLGERCLAGIR